MLFSPEASALRHSRLMQADPTLFLHRGFVRRPLDRQMPLDISRNNLKLVSEVLSAAGIEFFLIRTSAPSRHTVGVDMVRRADVIAAFAEHAADRPAYIQVPVRDQPMKTLAALAARNGALSRAEVLRVAELYATPDRSFGLQMTYGCDIEFWQASADGASTMTGPRPNMAGATLPCELLQTEDVTIGTSTYPMATVFRRQLLEDIVFPIDVVYTWVDGDDPAWRERLGRARAEADGLSYHPMAYHDARYRSRDELRYSLRSLSMYAPWVRTIFLVTDGQRPTWLDTSDARVVIVTHDEIFANNAVLPVFNSSAIISQLHHIAGLSEHYLYLNDDVFFGRPTTPSMFFTVGGQAKVFPSRNARPFGAATHEDEPHINLTRNMRRLVEERFGRTVTRAVKHTPHAQLRSVQYDMEEIYSAAYAATAASRFRSHSDIAADQLFEYHGQLTGDAVSSGLRYDYVNLGDSSYTSNLASLLQSRDRYVFCLNDAPSEDKTPIDPDRVQNFLDRYFPIASPYELDG